MIGKEDLEIWVMRAMDPSVYCMVFGAGIGCVLYAMEFHVGEVADDLDFLDLAVLLHDVLDETFVHLLEPADEELAD